jgi:hypothetical protein
LYLLGLELHPNNKENVMTLHYSTAYIIDCTPLKARAKAIILHSYLIAAALRPCFSKVVRLNYTLFAKCKSVHSLTQIIERSDESANTSL